MAAEGPRFGVYMPALRPLPKCGHADMARPISHRDQAANFLARGTEVGSRAPGPGHDETQRHATGIISVNDERQVKLGRHGDIIDDVDALIHTHLCMFREFLCNRACYGHELWQVTVCRRVTSSNQVETPNDVSTGKPSATNASRSMVPGLSKGRLTTNAVVETMPDAMAAGGAMCSPQ